MLLNEIIPLLALFSIFAGLAITLFRIRDSKQDKLDAYTASAYEYLKQHTLDPILEEIFGSKRGKYKPREFFNTPEVIQKLSQYRKHIFKFNKVSEMGVSIIMMLELSLLTSSCLAAVIMAYIATNELFINSAYNTFGVSILHMAVLCSGICATLGVFLIFFLKKFVCINDSFREQIAELKDGLS